MQDKEISFGASEERDLDFDLVSAKHMEHINKVIGFEGLCSLSAERGPPRPI